MKLFPADLHIHTALSPCALAEMTPAAIVEQAIRRRMSIIAVTDHNAADNIAAVQEAAGDALWVVPGLELTTAEEVHVLGLFPTPADAAVVAATVQAGLPPCRENPRGFGRQSILNAAGEEIGVADRLLGAASELALGDAVALIARHGGLVIAAHINRPSFSVLSQLGFFPVDIRFDAAEISAAGVARGEHECEPYAAFGLPLVSSSDSHQLDVLGRGFVVCEMAELSFAELARAIRGQEGRRCWIA